MKSIPVLVFSLLILVPCSAADSGNSSKPAPTVVSTAVLRRKPEAKVRADPIYPEELRKRGDSGTALIEFVITPKGETTDVKVVKASHPAFGVAARDAVLRSRFTPGIAQNGEPVAVRLQVPFTFTPPSK